MTTSSMPNANVVPFVRRPVGPMDHCPTTDCVDRAMAVALQGRDETVWGRIVHGRAFLSGSVASETERRQVELSVRRLHCVVDVINNIAVDEELPQPPVRSKLAVRPVSAPNLPLVYVSSYCSLDDGALRTLIEDASAVLAQHIGIAGAAVSEAIIFYSTWHGDAAMIDVALPSPNALDRRPANAIRGTVLPCTRHRLEPDGGINGLAAARRALAAKCAWAADDPMFRIWQRVRLIDGKLAQGWLNAAVETAQ